MRKAATYLRVSRADQRPALQADETEQLIDRRGWKLVGKFVDEGISGAKSKRPGLNAMMQEAKRGTFNVLVVYKCDRLFRSTGELCTIVDELGALGVGFVSVTESFDTTTPSGRALLELCAVFATFERGVMRERTRAGIAAARERGAVIGRPRAIVNVPGARELRAQGLSYKAIAAELGVGQGTIYRALQGVPKPPAEDLL